MLGQADAKVQHEKFSNGGNISITWNVAHTQALVKVSGGKDANWQQNKIWLANAIAVYDEATHKDIFQWFYTDEWQPKVDEVK